MKAYLRLYTSYMGIICILGTLLGVFIMAPANAATIYDDDYVWLTNQDGKLVGSDGCVLTQTQVDQSGDPDFDVWECLENNPTPGIDQRTVLTDTNGNPIIEKRVVGHEGHGQ